MIDKVPVEALDSAKALILKLTADLRQMDQLIYRMGQCTDWSQMRPIFVELHANTMKRMQTESDRIRLLMVPEIVRTYAQHQTTQPEYLQLDKLK